MNVESLLARLRAMGAAFSGKQLVTLAVVFIAVVGLTVGSAYWIGAPTYSVLFSDMDPESANSVVTRLKNDKVPYTLDEGGRTIRVPASRLDELRLEVVSQGLPASGRIGFEIFDRTSFGVTDFLEHVNYRRALEGELARTIGTIGEVASARVHIAMSRPSLFAGQDKATTASVVLKLRGRALSASTITAITGLVAAGVEGLQPDGVVIIDNFGRPLTRPNDGSGAASSALQVERQQRIEQELSARVVSLLEPIVGVARVRVNVSAKLHTDSQEETEERWDPTPVVRSHQSVIQGGATTGLAQGVAGVRSNSPPSLAGPPKDPTPAVQTGTLAAVAPSHSSESTNYEVGKVTRHRIQPQGQIAKLSVAVLLDDERTPGTPGATGTPGTPAQSKPRSAAEVQKITQVVAAAVGLDEERGDKLTVENIAFEEPVVEEPVATPWWGERRPGDQTWWSRYAPLVFSLGRIVAILLIVALVVFGVVRPTLRRTLGAPELKLALAAPPPARTVADLEGELDAQFDEVEDDPATKARMPALTRKVAKLAQSEPENTARLVRAWLAEEER